MFECGLNINQVQDGSKTNTEGLSKYSNLHLTNMSYFLSLAQVFKCDPGAQKVLGRWGIFVAKAKNTLYGSKLSICLLWQKSLGYLYIIFHEDIL